MVIMQAADFRSVFLFSTIFFLNLCAFPANCQQTPGGSISGMVLLAPDNEPVARAWVTVRAAPPSEDYGRTYTDSEGRFTIGGLPAGEYIVFVKGNGLESRWFGAGRDGTRGKMTLLQPGEHRTGLRIVLRRQASVSGIALDQDGEPVAEAQVSLFKPAFTGGQRSFRMVGSTTTDDRGEFRLYHVNPGRYYLAATLQSLPTGTGTTPEAVPLGQQQKTLLRSASAGEIWDRREGLP